MSSTDTGDSVVPRSEPSYLISLIETGPPTYLSRRILSLHPGQTATLGRLSKNQKTGYLARTTNGYFDNPIISRCHAILSHRQGEIYIIDKMSTHGTYLNGSKLTPDFPYKLDSGDIIRLGCPIESTVAGEHLPTELHVGLTPMQLASSLRNLNRPVDDSTPETTNKQATNSFHAPDDDEDSAADNADTSHTMAWQPFAPNTTVAAAAPVQDFSRPALVPAEPANQLPSIMSVFPVFAEMSPSKNMREMTDTNPWAAGPEPGHDHYALDEHDQEAYFSDEADVDDEDQENEEEDYEFPYDYQTEDKESVNVGEEKEKIQVPETQVVEKPDIIDLTTPTDMSDEGKEQETDTWKDVKSFLHTSNIDHDMGSDDDSEYGQFSSEEEEEEEEYDESDMNDEEEEDYDEDEDDEEIYEDEYDSEWMNEEEQEEDGSEPEIIDVTRVAQDEVTMVPETQVQMTKEQTPEIVIAESIPEPTIPTVAIPSTESIIAPTTAVPAEEPVASQTQTPPITPEHHPNHRKRQCPSEEESSSPLSDSYPTLSSVISSSHPAPPAADSLSDRKIAPLRRPSTPSLTNDAKSLALADSQFEGLDKQVKALAKQNILLEMKNTELTQTIKRRKLNPATEGQAEGRGWVGVAKTVGKYTVAGVIGGIATVVGLAWNAGA